MTLVLVNPTAGGGRAGRQAEALLKGLSEDLDVRRTVGPGHATALVQEARRRGVQRFISVGGDGTLFEVVNGALTAGEGRPVIGVLPLGTGNSFGRDLGITTPDQAIAALRGGNTRVIDALCLSHTTGPTWSVNLVGLGFSAAAGSLMNRRFKRLGVLGYVFAVVVEVGRLGAPMMRFRLDGAPWIEEPLLMLSLCNSQYTGGAMHMAPDACIDDGLIDLIRLGPMSRSRFLSAFPKIFQGTHPELEEVQTGRAKRIEFGFTAAIDVMVDGEVLNTVPEALEVHPGALEMMCL